MTRWTKGQQLAVIDSPELRSRLVQEESTLASLDAGARRAGLDARIARLNARKTLDQAEISHTAAQRDLQRYQTAYEQGAVSQTDFAHAQDELKKTTLGLSTARAREDFELQSAGSELDARNKRPAGRQATRGRNRGQAPGGRADPARALRRPGRPGAGPAGHQRRGQRAGAERGGSAQLRGGDQGAGELRARPRTWHCPHSSPVAREIPTPAK